MQVLTAPASFGHSDCERIVGTALAQPVLAVTSLAYVAAGMVVLCWAMRLRAPLAGTAGVALVAVGAGSFAYHGPQLGLVAYAAGRSGSPLCRPDSLWQYHGAWHVLSGAAAGWAARAIAPVRPVSVNQGGKRGLSVARWVR